MRGRRAAHAATHRGRASAAPAPSRWCSQVLFAGALLGVCFATAAAGAPIASASQTFSTQECKLFTPPAGATTVKIQAVGAAGAAGKAHGAVAGGAGGDGDGVSAAYTGLLDASNELAICVEERGGYTENGKSTEAGGGASSVYVKGKTGPLVVAAGGGSGGFAGYEYAGGAGGNAGEAGHEGGHCTSSCKAGNTFATGGGAGTEKSGGAAGTPGSALAGTLGEVTGGGESFSDGRGGEGGQSLQFELHAEVFGGAGAGGYSGGGGGGAPARSLSEAAYWNGGGGGGGGSDFCGNGATGCETHSKAGTSHSAGTEAGQAKVVLTFEGAPKVTVQPTSESLLVGEKTAFTAACAGYPPPTIEWEVRRVGVIGEWADLELSGGTLALSASEVTGETPWEFRAHCTNSAGGAYTSAAALNIYEAPKITLQPQSVSIHKEEVAVFKTECTGSPTLTIQWEYMPEGGTQWIPYATGKVAEFLAPGSEWSGTKWRAVCSNGHGSPAVSNTVTMTVGEAPRVTTQPTDQTVSEQAGANASFTSGCGGEPAPEEEWQFLSVGASEWTAAEVTGPTYTIPPSRAFSGWQLRLRCTNRLGTVYSNPATLTVNWVEVTSEPSSTVVTLGGTATFKAACAGSPAPEIQWYAQGGAPVGGATSDTLTVPASALTQSGEAFYAQCHSEAGVADTVVASMTVEPRPTITKLKGTSGPVTGGAVVTITGTGFSGASGVLFGGHPAGYEVRSGTEIRAIVPAVETAGIVNVTVARYGGESLPVKADNYKYQPLITALEPSSGSTAGYTFVQVYGHGFSTAAKATTFKVGTLKPLFAACYASTVCEIEVPPHAAGKVELKVTVNKAAAAAKNAAAGFTYE